jgi:hypothetical protein
MLMVVTMLEERATEMRGRKGEVRILLESSKAMGAMISTTPTFSRKAEKRAVREQRRRRAPPGLLEALRRRWARREGSPLSEKRRERRRKPQYRPRTLHLMEFTASSGLRAPTSRRRRAEERETRESLILREMARE